MSKPTKQPFGNSGFQKHSHSRHINVGSATSSSRGEAMEGRQALSLDSFIRRSGTYDRREKQRKQFVNRASQLRSYERTLRKEGMAEAAPSARGGFATKEIDYDQYLTEEEREELRAARAAERERLLKRKRRMDRARNGGNPDKSEDDDEEEAEEGGAAKRSRVAPSADEEDEHLTGPLTLSQAGKKKKKQTLADIAKSARATRDAEAAAVRAEAEAKRAEQAAAAKEREARRVKLSARTKKGQPVMQGLIEDLYAKLQKPSAAAATAAPSASASARASGADASFAAADAAFKAKFGDKSAYNKGGFPHKGHKGGFKFNKGGHTKGK